MAGTFKLKTSPTQLFWHIPVNSKCRLAKGSSTDKALVFKGGFNKSSRNFSSRKNKSLLSKLAEVDSKPGYSFSNKGLHYTILELPFQQKITNFNYEFAIKGDAEEKRQKLYSPVINLKTLSKFIPFLRLKRK